MLDLKTADIFKMFSSYVIHSSKTPIVFPPFKFVHCDLKNFHSISETFFFPVIQSVYEILLFYLRFFSL